MTRKSSISYKLGGYEADITIELFEEYGYVKNKDLDKFFKDCYFDFETKLTEEKFIKVSKDNLLKHPKYKEFLNNEVKMCGECKIVKPLSSFWGDAYRYDDKRYYCSSCCNKRNMEWKTNNKEKVSKHNATYYKKHKEAIREQQKAWAKKNKDKCNLTWKRYHLRKKLKVEGYREELLTRNKLDLIIQIKVENKIKTYKETIEKFKLL